VVERAERLDFELLLDRLQEVIESASRVPFGSRVMVDQQDCESIIGQMRVTLPNQLEEAQRIIAERETILEQARFEAQSVLEQANQQASHEALQHEIVRLARGHAAEIEQRALADSERTREETDEYARQVLSRLTHRVEATLRALKTGALELERSSATSERRSDPDTGQARRPERRVRSARTPSPDTPEDQS